MDQPPEDPLIGFAVLATLLASIATWLALITRWRRGKPLLEYEPRSPVPWGAPIAMLAVVFVAIALLTPSGIDGGAEQPAPPHPLEVSQRLVGFILFQSAVIGGVLAIVAIFYRASLRDLGLPLYADEFVRDVRLGIIASLAAIAPVYGVQLLMIYLFGPSEHPLVEMVTSGQPHVGVVFLASIAAVVIAPVSEEILFRLLLQGWLEKWEDRPSRPHEGVNDEARTNDEARMTNDESETPVDSSFVIRHSSLDEPDPPLEPSPRRLAGLPHGLLPILISSLLFAIAHSGYGPDPIAIFFLAIILGYVYQRTHRIVPCMVAHALFNSVAMLILWRMVLLNTE
jgi:membrane protease YdiL (CAAX protease family)